MYSCAEGRCFVFKFEADQVTLAITSYLKDSSIIGTDKDPWHILFGVNDPVAVYTVATKDVT